MARRKKEYLNTPIGTFIYPHLNSPDTKFDEAGVYTVKVRPDDPKDNAALKSKVDALMEEALAGENMDPRTAKAHAAAVKKLGKGKSLKQADPPYSPDEDNPDLMVFNFKMKASGKTRDGETYTRSPKLFDAQGNPCPDARIGGGTKGRVSFEPYRFYTALIGAGVSLRLEAVQIVELVEWGGRSAESFGFEAVDGFSIEDHEGNFESGDGDEDLGDEDSDADDFDF